MKLIDRFKYKATASIVSGVAAGALLFAPVAMAHGSHDSGRGGSSNRSLSSQSRVASNSPNKQSRSDDNRRGGDNSKWHQHKLTCDQKQAALNKQAADSKARYEKRLTGLNIVYSGVQTYVSSGSVTVENYDAQNAKVAADQTAATNAVNAIAAPTLTCTDDNSSDAANDEATRTFYANWKAADKAVATYRVDLTNLFKAVTES